MTLQVFTARVSYGGPDRFDVTRKSGGTGGVVFAPSWAILGPALAARKESKQLMDECLRLSGLPETMARESEFPYMLEAERIEEGAWKAYVPAYTAEMRGSYREHRSAWDALLARERVTLVCYCVDPERCHRRLLAGFLVKLGAVDCGERRQS